MRDSIVCVEPSATSQQISAQCVFSLLIYTHSPFCPERPVQCPPSKLSTQKETHVDRYPDIRRSWAHREREALPFPSVDLRAETPGLWKEQARPSSSADFLISQLYYCARAGKHRWCTTTTYSSCVCAWLCRVLAPGGNRKSSRHRTLLSGLSRLCVCVCRPDRKSATASGASVFCCFWKVKTFEKRIANGDDNCPRTRTRQLWESMANPRSGTSQNHRSRRISYVST